MLCFFYIPCRYSYIDFLRYAWGALMKNQFGGDRNIILYTEPEPVTILDVYNLGGINAWEWAAIEAAFFFAFFFFAFLALRFINHTKR